MYNGMVGTQDGMEDGGFNDYFRFEGFGGGRLCVHTFSCFMV